MSESTGIAWTRSSWSPWWGCTEVSPGCDHCYARAIDNRHRLGGAKHWGAGVPRYRTSTANWRHPIQWDKKAAASGERWTVFPSMCDPFDNEVPQQWMADFLTLTGQTPNLTWLLLTKRIGNVAKHPLWHGDLWPNVWLGASVVNQAEADRDIPKLLATPAAKRFVSYEPALGPIDWRWPLYDVTTETRTHNGKRQMKLVRRTPCVDWIIVGGESAQGGAKARPFDLAWARSTVAQCRVAGVACFFKQAGSNPVVDGRPLKLRDRAGADMAELPPDLQIQEFPNGA